MSYYSALSTSSPVALKLFRYLNKSLLKISVMAPPSSTLNPWYINNNAPSCSLLTSIEENEINFKERYCALPCNLSQNDESFQVIYWSIKYLWTNWNVCLQLLLSYCVELHRCFSGTMTNVFRGFCSCCLWTILVFKKKKPQKILFFLIGLQKVWSYKKKR